MEDVRDGIVWLTFEYTDPHKNIKFCKHNTG